MTPPVHEGVAIIQELPHVSSQHAPNINFCFNSNRFICKHDRSAYLVVYLTQCHWLLTLRGGGGSGTARLRFQPGLVERGRGLALAREYEIHSGENYCKHPARNHCLKSWYGAKGC